jgi:predicted secreted protein
MMPFSLTIGLPVPTLIALYFIIWWVSLFAVLPLGVQNAEEAGEVRDAYADPGAPVQPRLGMKALITSIVALPLTYIVALVITHID